MENDEKYLHGRLDPGIESTVQLVEGVESPDISKFFSLLEAPSPKPPQANNAVFPGIKPSNENQFRLNHLPVELLYQISSYLPPCDLAKLGKVCKTLSDVAKNDSLWRSHIQQNVPGINLQSPSPYASFKDLYKSHDPHWFLTKNKLWFADHQNYGQLMISKYHPETGSIKMHRLITQRQPPQFMTWKDDTSVIIHFFDPKVYLAEYCLQLGRDAYSHRSLSKMGEAERRLKGELPMVGTGDSFGSRASSQFMLAKSLAGNIPQADKWPPPNILAKSQVDRPKLSRNLAEYQPENRSQINEQSFRTRQWIEMNGQVRIGEMVQTWATLDFDLYTPTENHPYKGIFVGDYSGHGCEYLLLDQRNRFDEYDESNLSRPEDEALEAWEARQRHAGLFTSSLCAIKLTGDPNIPRGEVTWIADDIGDKGFVRYGEQEWPGIRIVKSRGQIANTGYKDPKWIETELIMISHDVLAQHWVPFGHISFFHRVNIDDFIKP